MAISVRQTAPSDFAAIIDISRRVYVHSPPWSERQLNSHLHVFPEGQFVAVDEDSGRVIGMAASLIIYWDDYDMDTAWRDVTAGGMFTNHDPARGRTLYGAEVIVDPSAQGRGAGSALYMVRRQFAERRGLLRIRAGARLRGYHRYADKWSAEDYTERVVRGEVHDPTLTFQLRRGFEVMQVVGGYLRHDPESLGFAAIIEWLNPARAQPEDYGHGNPRYRLASRPGEGTALR